MRAVGRRRVPVTIHSVGVFLAAKEPERLLAWYRALGVPVGDEGYGAIGGKDPVEGSVFSVMPAGPDLPPAPADVLEEEPYGRRAIMLNFRVSDLAKAVAGLRARGEIVAGPTDHGYGVFAWVKDPEGNLVELWQAASRS